MTCSCLLACPLLFWNMHIDDFQSDTQLHCYLGPEVKCKFISVSYNFLQLISHDLLLLEVAYCFAFEMMSLFYPEEGSLVLAGQLSFLFRFRKGLRKRGIVCHKYRWLHSAEASCSI